MTLPLPFFFSVSACCDEDAAAVPAGTKEAGACEACACMAGGMLAGGIDGAGCCKCCETPPVPADETGPGLIEAGSSSKRPAFASGVACGATGGAGCETAAKLMSPESSPLASPARCTPLGAEEFGAPTEEGGGVIPPMLPIFARSWRLRRSRSRSAGIVIVESFETRVSPAITRAGGEAWL